MNGCHVHNSVTFGNKSDISGEPIRTLLVRDRPSASRNAGIRTKLSRDAYLQSLLVGTILQVLKSDVSFAPSSLHSSQTYALLDSIYKHLRQNPCKIASKLPDTTHYALIGYGSKWAFIVCTFSNCTRNQKPVHNLFLKHQLVTALTVLSRLCTRTNSLFWYGTLFPTLTYVSVTARSGATRRFRIMFSLDILSVREQFANVCTHTSTKQNK